MTEILLVEDNSAVRLAYRLLLTNAGYTVTEAKGGQEALAVLDGRGFDLVITDLLMPEVNGYMVIAHAKRLWPQSRVLAVTGGLLGGATQNPDVRARAVGADLVIEKPMLGDGLLAAVKNILRRLSDPTLKETPDVHPD